MKRTNVGLDPGNRRWDIAIEAIKNDEQKLLFASIPALYAFDEPVLIKAGQERKIDAFSLLFKVNGKGNVRLWFGNDTLTSENTIQKLDTTKYIKSHIQRMTQAVLYQWSKQHSISLASLGKLNICVSMPPGAYQKTSERKRAEKVYRASFNTGQSHIQLRDGKDSVQVVTQFHSLVREAVLFGSEIPRRNELVLTFDFGGGTDDVILFNGSPEPYDSKTFKNGLIKVYHKINPANPLQAELRILRDKNYLPPALLAYFNQRELMVQMALRDLPEKMSKKVYIIGGGAVMIGRNPTIKKTFLSLLPPKKLIIKNQYANAEANWKEASK